MGSEGYDSLGIMGPCGRRSRADSARARTAARRSRQAIPRRAAGGKPQPSCGLGATYWRDPPAGGLIKTTTWRKRADRRNRHSRCTPAGLWADRAENAVARPSPCLEGGGHANCPGARRGLGLSCWRRRCAIRSPDDSVTDFIVRRGLFRIPRFGLLVLGNAILALALVRCPAGGPGSVPVRVSQRLALCHRLPGP